MNRAFPGASFDRATTQFLVPGPEGRVRISPDRAYAQCAQAEPSAWPEIARRWTLEIRTSIASAGATPAIAMSALRLRVTPRWSEQDAAAIVRQPIPFEFDGVVTLADDTQRWSYPTPADVEGLGTTWDLVGAALRQTITEEIFDVDVRDHDVAGHRLRLLAKDGCPYVSTALLSMQRFVPDSDRYGALVIIPTYSAVGMHEVHERSALDLIPTLSAMATDLSQGDAQPCSAEVYWWYQQVFYRIGVRAGEAAAPVVDLPEDLRALAHALP